MRSNKLLEKADIAISDLTTNGGYLPDDVAASFFRKVIIQPTIFNATRTVIMNAPKAITNTIGLGSRIMRPSAANAGLLLADRFKPDLGQIELDTTEIMAEIHIPYDVMEDNIERTMLGMQGMTPGDIGGSQVTGGIRDTILNLMVERVAVDLEELVLLGDTAHATDTYLQLMDGFLKIASTGGNVVATAASPSKTIFKEMIQAMPDQYIRYRNQMGIWLSPHQELEYRDTLATRETPIGDAHIQSELPTYAFGVPIRTSPQMPNARSLFCDPRNLIVGFWRQLSLETDKDIQARNYIMVLTARIGCTVELPDAIVYASSLT